MCVPLYTCAHTCFMRVRACCLRAHVHVHVMCLLCRGSLCVRRCVSSACVHTRVCTWLCVSAGKRSRVTRVCSRCLHGRVCACMCLRVCTNVSVGVRACACMCLRVCVFTRVPCARDSERPRAQPTKALFCPRDFWRHQRPQSPGAQSAAKPSAPAARARGQGAAVSCLPVVAAGLARVPALPARRPSQHTAQILLSHSMGK